MTSRLAVLGGMFDPVHNGHIAAARYALNHLRVNRVKLIPCHSPNHKPWAMSDSTHRLAMLELAVSTDEKIEVDSIEIDRSGVSYTVDTLTALKKAEHPVLLVFVLGVDAFNLLPEWQRWSELPELCHFLVLGRPRAEISRSTAELIKLEQRLVRSSAEMFDSESGKILLGEDFNVEISSSSIREKLAKNLPVQTAMNDSVISYIKDHHLYDVNSI